MSECNYELVSGESIGNDAHGIIYVQTKDGHKIDANEVMPFIIRVMEEKDRKIAALTEELECFRAKTAPESLGYGAKWKQKAMKARDERNKLRGALEEIADTKNDMAGVICRLTARQALSRE
ncbi:hypothetical protein JOD82_002055 [Paenibacillus sp. 1182]|uniref:hypothetical protein n=1 Tax=Paenibacillus sp. 1182 TaxID=2806565 RepID=UPI001AE42188|nr:hypothetical protein [Paenibacillus sp. 1182]MBP1309035.1 hypothetical protein [Paenibacillus sp. 1182]